MSREVFHYPVPGRFEYEWNYIRGKGAMSSSAGIVLMPDEMLRIMPPNALRRVFLGPNPARALEMDLGEGFPRFMDRFNAESGEMDVPFSHLAVVAQTFGDDANAAAEMLRRGGYGKAAENVSKLRQYLNYARNWVERWAPEQSRFRVLDLPESREAALQLSEEQRDFLDYVGLRIAQVGDDPDRIQNFLYAAAEQNNLRPNKAFAAIYRVLLGKKSGPKAGPYLASLKPQVVQERFIRVSRDTLAGRGRE
jgi:lysyl-tRNA synthetase class 1